MVSIDGRKIGRAFPPYIVAELSANHNGNIDQALTLIEEAKKAGADAVKIQTYTPDTITLDCDLPDFQITEGQWAGQTLYQLYGKAFTPWEWHKPLFEHAKKIGITIFSSPFDFSAVDLLVDLDAPAIKIASFELVDLPLIKYAAATGKPLILSTGMANRNEIGEAISAARNGGCKDLIVLHCVSGYPAPPEQYNLKTLSDIEMEFCVPVGLSDHTISNVTAISSIPLGACFIEKHFTLDRSVGGPDDAFSIEPPQLQKLCVDSKTAWEAVGSVHYGLSSSESENKRFRRSLYVVSDIQAGDVISHENVRSIRPGFGCLPKYLEQLLGKTANRDLPKGTPMQVDYVND